MNYEVKPAGKGGGEPLKIGLREAGEGIFEIQIDGETVHVDAVKSGPTVYSIIENGKQFEAMVDEQGAHGFDVLVGGALFHLEAIDERTQLLSGAAVPLTQGKQSVEAEMPGKVVRVAVSAGAEVEQGQGVVIIEAMKMENEISSPIDGVITEIKIGEGDTVEPGTLLFVVEPPEQE